MPSHTTRELLTVNELSALTGLSLSTLHRLKNAGRIPFYQPAGPGSRLLFPRDALERTAGSSADLTDSPPPTSSDKTPVLSGPQPRWMSNYK